MFQRSHPADTAEDDVVSPPGPSALLPNIRLDRDWVSSFDAYPFSLPAVRHMETGLPDYQAAP